MWSAEAIPSPDPSTIMPNDMAASTDESQEPVAYIVSRGRLADFILRWSLPAIAWPGQSLFRVVLHGHGFVHTVEGLPPRIGFYVTYFIAARNVRAAEASAIQRLADRWETFFAHETTGQLIIETHETERLQDRFLRRSRWGMAFYNSADEAAPTHAIER